VTLVEDELAGVSGNEQVSFVTPETDASVRNGSMKICDTCPLTLVSKLPLSWLLASAWIVSAPNAQTLFSALTQFFIRLRRD
jgi:hypothetical protein